MPSNRKLNQVWDDKAQLEKMLFLMERYRNLVLNQWKL